MNLDVDAAACRAACVAAGAPDFPFAPFAGPAGCGELLAADLDLFRNYSQRGAGAERAGVFRATALEVLGHLARRAQVSAADAQEVKLYPQPVFP